MPSSKCERGLPDVEISIVSETELRVHDNCKDVWSQKYVLADGGPQETNFSFDELKDLACMLHDAPEFKIDKDPIMAKTILGLGSVLVSSDLTRQKLVGAMHSLMKRWLTICQNDTTCILPVSLTNLNDPNQIKQQRKFERIQEALRQATLANIKGIVNLTPEQTKTLDAEIAAESLRQR